MNPYAVDRGRWRRLSTIEQLANIGSEVGRSLNAERAQRIDDRDAAVRRALDLFNATVKQLIGVHSPRVREVLRARDQFLTLFFDGPFNDKAATSLERYFLAFGILARQRAGV